MWTNVCLSILTCSNSSEASTQRVRVFLTQCFVGFSCFYFILFPFEPLPSPKHKQKNLCKNLLLPTQALDRQGQASLQSPLITLWGLVGGSPLLAASPSRRMGGSHVSEAVRAAQLCPALGVWALTRCVSLWSTGDARCLQLVPEPGAEFPIPSLVPMVLPLGLDHLPSSSLPLVLGHFLPPAKLCSWIHILVTDPLGTGPQICDFSCQLLQGGTFWAECQKPGEGGLAKRCHLFALTQRCCHVREK